MDTNANNDSNVAIHDVKERRCKKGLILGILAVLIIAIGSLLTIIFLKKIDDKSTKYFKKVTYFYGTSTTNLDGPIPMIIKFEKNGKYMTVSAGPSYFGEIGTYEITDNKITLNTLYVYNANDGLTASVSTVRSSGTYKNDEINIFKYKFVKTDNKDYDKFNKKGYTYSDVEKAYKNGGIIDKPVDGDDELNTYCDGEKAGIISSKDHTFDIKYEADADKNEIKVIVTNEEGKEIINNICFIRYKGHMFEFAINADDTITVLSPVDENNNSVPREAGKNKFIVDVLGYDGNKVSTKELECKDLSLGTPQAISDQETICPEEY